MADLRVITILPPPQVQGVQQPQVSGNPTPQGTIGSIPVGSILSGFIINRDTSGNPILRTDSGDITFASNFFLKIGSEITIRIEHIAGNNSAHILSVNGLPPEVAVLQSGLTQEPEVIVSVGSGVSAGVSGGEEVQNVQLQTNQTPVVTVKGTIIATPHNSSPAPSPTLTPEPPLPNGSQVALKITNIILPTANAQPQTPYSPTPILTPTPTPSATPSPTLTPSPAQQPATPSYASYARFAATPETIPTQTPSAPVPTLTPAPTPEIPTQTTPAQIGQQLLTAVISNDPNGEAIIQSPVGIIRLQAGTALPINSHVTFEIAEIKTPANPINLAVAAPLTTSPAPITALARNAGALSDIFSLLSGLGTQDAQNFVSNNIPNLGQPVNNPVTGQQQPAQHNFMASILGLTSALKNGDFEQWIGRSNARWLQDNGHENLLKKAEGEFMSIARQFTNPPAQQWQSLFFPVVVDGELQQTRLFVKRERKEKQGSGGREKQEDTRFVLEMDMSQLGEMQMDGFVKRTNQNIQFDLIIRSHTALAPQVQKDILAIYNDMGELTGYKGSLVFQNVKDFPVNPMEDIIGDDNEGVVA